MEVVECGAASLAMVMAYYGRNVTLEEVREACAVSRDGVNAAKMVEAAASYGFKARGMRYSVQDLERVEGPCIVYWNQSHFLVLEGFTRRKVHLNDPGAGRIAVSREEFVQGYSGVTLEVEPEPGFRRDPRSARVHPFRQALGLLGRSRSGVAYAAIAGVAVVVPTTVAAVLVSIFVAQVLDAGDQDWVGKVVGLAVVVVALELALTLFQQRILLRLQMKLSIRMSAQFVWHLLRVPTRFFDARSPGGLVSRVQLNEQVAQLLSGQLATATISIVTVLLFGLVLFVLNWQLALVALGVAAFNAVVLLSVSRARVAANQNLQQNLVRLSGYTFLGISLIDDIKATGSESDFFSRWSGTQAQALNAEQRLGALTQFLLVVPGFLALLNVVVILAVGGGLVIDQALTLPKLIAFQMLATSFLSPIGQLVSVASQFQDARAWLQQVDDVMAQPLDPLAVGADDAEPAVTPSLAPLTVTPANLSEWAVVPAGHRPGKLAGRVELRDVTFGYVRNEPPLIERLSIVVEPGQRVAFVGPTGSGKSTLANLVAGLLQPWSGDILFDGHRREDIPAEVFAASLAKVDQSIMIFQGSVADNIRFFDDTVPTQDVVRAAEDACLAEEIQAKPGAYSHLVREGGQNLSGGQRQRLELARALAGHPTIVVLDEATSSLDAVTEQQIDSNLRRRGCTSIIVAHRLSTIRDCDQIIVLERGRVSERGVHEDLVAAGGTYSALVANG